MRDFHVETAASCGDCAVMRVIGEVDVYTAPVLRERVIEQAALGTVHILADLGGVGFLDSTGLGVLVGSLKRLRAREGSLALVIDTDQILRIFQITGLAKVFPRHTSVTEAIASDPHWRKTVESHAASVEQWCREHGLS